MSFDKELAYDFLKSISFERLGGTPEENKTIRLICRAVKKAGVVPAIERFPIQTFTRGNASVEVLAPYRKLYRAKPVARTGRFPKGGKVLPLVHLGAMSPAALGNAKGKAIYGYGLWGKEAFKALENTRAAAVLNIFDFGRKLPYRFLHDRALKRLGRIPMLTLPYEAGLEMQQRNALKARIVLNQGERKAWGKNVIAVVKGTCPDAREEILVCGHHDSVPDSPGAHDNGGGAAILAALVDHFAQAPTRRTLRFIWFGGEEQGLLGSQAYVKAHARELKDVGIVINIDGAGRVIDSNNVVTTGHDDLKHFVDLIIKERGMNLRVDGAAFPSDSIPFSWHEIPSINLTAGSDRNLFAHTGNDDSKWCGPDGLAPNGEIGLEIIRRLGDALTFPFTHGFNETVQKSLKSYYESLMMSRKEMPLWCRSETSAPAMGGRTRPARARNA